MATAKKFGAFGGVFTPSILTILGVIMYLRLPWILGQAGLYTTLGIILIAHLISVTTGLSISSIATDKKVKGGGNYYLLSRSLGLPIGGTLGIALFVGLSLSVSLYIIGFSESFLGFIGIEVTKNTIRLAGTIALVSITVITFISTSLAIKTQYIIMTLMLLSLASIFLGGNSSAPALPVLNSLENSAPLMVLFGIFFPAVTGFEAGVSMSGDLKDPKKSIPGGTITAVVTGLVVYIILTIFLAYRVDAESLVNNPNILLEISIFSPLVLAGIWGATISSALGSILGAPRILQATSVDRITPKFFEKGYGKDNEPRNALLFTFILAEAGILLGELNLIARIVSMFFITTYGFLNLSCAIENWASSDFRPSFKVPTWISIIGSAAAFLVMIELDVIALVVASLLLGLIFITLKRRELTLESGDTWEGVWSSMVRTGLQKLNRSDRHARNWRPNIILFSGGTGARPQLVEFGQWLVHKRGILSNFDLVENTKAKALFPKMGQDIKETDEEFFGVFRRRIECQNIYEGIETISKIYGFSGIDPNSIMMGWARNSNNPDRFAELINEFSELDYNVLILDYDKDVGFGKKENIDIWWRGGSNNAALAMTMAKFLLSAEEWHDARVRILIVVDDSALINKVYKNMNLILEEERLDAKVKVINNAIEKRPFEEIIKVESVDADLSILGIPGLSDKNIDDFVSKTNSLLDTVGTVLLIQAASFFKPLFIGIERTIPVAQDHEPPAEEKFNLPELVLPESGLLSKTISGISDQLEKEIDEYFSAYFKNFSDSEIRFLSKLNNSIERYFISIENGFTENKPLRFQKLLMRVQSDYLFHSRRLLEEFKSEIPTEQKENLEQGLDIFLKQLDTLTENVPHRVGVTFEPFELKASADDSFQIHMMKFRKRFRHRLTKKPIVLNIDLKSLVEYHILTVFLKKLYSQLDKAGIESYRRTSDLQKFFNRVRDSLNTIEDMANNRQLDENFINDEKSKTLKQLQDLITRSEQQFSDFRMELLLQNRVMMQNIITNSIPIDAGRRLKKKFKISKSDLEIKENILAAPSFLAKNKDLIVNFTLMDLILMALQYRFRIIVTKQISELRVSVENKLIAALSGLESDINNIKSTKKPETRVLTAWALNPEEIIDNRSIIEELVSDIRSAIDEIPETVDIITEGSFQNIEINQFDDTEVISIYLQRLMDYLVEKDFLTPFRKEISSLPGVFRQAVGTARDVVRLISFNISSSRSSEETGIDDMHDPIDTIIEKSNLRIISERERISAQIQKMEVSLWTHLTKTFSSMNPYLVTREIGHLGQYIRQEESRKVLSQVQAVRETVKKTFRDTLVRLLYSQSEGVLFARKFTEKEFAYPGRISTVLNMVEKVSPPPSVLKSLPFYYKQLFIGKHFIGREFRINRAAEMKTAEKAVSRYKQGFSGGILITGAPDAGKSSLSNAIATKFFDKDKVFHIFPPETGSIEPDVFKAHLNSILQSNGEPAEIFDAMPAGSVFIFNDLELWWERSNNGFALVDQIMTLIERFGRRHLFIVNTNTYSFRFINRMKRIDNHFISIIECTPFDTEDIKEALLMRHRSTGFKFQLNGHFEDNISEFKLVRYFNKFFVYSDGNIGTALQGWFSHIESVAGNVLTLREPERPDSDELHKLEPDWLVWLIQFIIHKRLTIEKLGRIFSLDPEKVRTQIELFKRSGLVTEIQTNHLELNQYLQPFIIRKFIEMEIL
ncbi:MAG: amino acid permease [Calditrichaceae bacterium]